MTKELVLSKLTEIFRATFEEPDVEIRLDMTAEKVKGWNSVTHIDMICEIEDQFGVVFATAEIAGLRDVGALVDLILKKIGNG